MKIKPNIWDIGYFLQDVETGKEPLIDFVVPFKYEDRAMVFIAGWHLDPFDPELIITVNSTLYFEDGSYFFDSLSRFIIHPADSKSQTQQIEDFNGKKALAKGTYVQALYNTARTNPDVQFTHQIRHALQMDSKSVNEILSENNSRLQELGGIVLKDADNRVVDSLVIDKQGNTATTQQGSRLDAYSDQWEEAKDTTSIIEFLSWVKEQEVYGPFAFGEIFVGERQETVEEVAANLVHK